MFAYASTRAPSGTSAQLARGRRQPRSCSDGANVVGPVNRLPRDPIDKDRLAVGDICFEMQGGSTNRRYAAFEYQPTGAAIVTSPVSDGRIGTYLRKAWSSDKQDSDLFNSLIADARDRHDWDLAAGGVIRLIKYYPSGRRQVASGLRARREARSHE